LQDFFFFLIHKDQHLIDGLFAEIFFVG
jgi:hypothetical protein